uniref:Transcription initiation factor TFIID subunit 11 n=1 Tax=Cacopsylla melanoneura TaxID=428564 RepID=A0A8D8WJT0_9HEMI
MASLFKIKEEEDDSDNNMLLNKVSDLPSIEHFTDDNMINQNITDSDNSSSDEKQEVPTFTTLETMSHNALNLDAENATFDLLDSNFTIKFEEPSGSSHLPSNSKSQSLKRRKSEEAREEAKKKKEMEEEERERMQVLVSNFTEDQLDRYEMYRRAAFPKAAIKRLVQTISGGSVSQNVVIAMSGIAKVYVGEIVEQALDVMEQQGESGPLQPKHLREAIRVIKSRGGMPSKKPKKPFTRI